MTYSALQLFKSIFLTEGKNAPTTSDYAEHLNGNKPLVAKFEDSRFIMAKWVDGEIDGHTPLVKFVGEGEKWLGLFLKHKTDNLKELFERISCYFPVELDFPEEVELPFFGASLEQLSPLNDDGNNFRFLEEALEYLKDKAVNEADIGRRPARREGTVTDVPCNLCTAVHNRTGQVLPRRNTEKGISQFIIKSNRRPRPPV